MLTNADLTKRDTMYLSIVVGLIPLLLQFSPFVAALPAPSNRQNWDEYFQDASRDMFPEDQQRISDELAKCKVSV